jgi:type IX secretion system PorP/SprF family membrane protein
MSYLFDQYKYTVNPAALRIGKGVNLHGSFCNDWYKEASANRFYGLGVEGGFFKQNMGLGLVLTQENAGFLAQTNVKLAYAYLVKLSENNFLSFGISAGYSHTGIRKGEIFKGLDFDESDPLLALKQDGFIGAFGMQYRWKELELDVAIPTWNTINLKHIPLFASFSYNIKFKENWGLKPVLMYHYLNPNMHLVEGRLQMSYKDYFWLQAGFRSTKELVVGIGGEIKHFQIGAAFGFNTGEYNTISRGNFEFVLGYRFVNAVVKNTRSELDESTRKNITTISKDISSLKEDNNKQITELQKINSSIAALNQDILRELKESLNEIKEEVQSIQKEDLVVDETKVLDKQYFVVVFSTTSQEDADRIVNRMAQQQVKGEIIRDSKRSHFYIYTETYDNLQAAVAQATAEKARGFTGAWVLIVK